MHDLIGLVNSTAGLTITFTKDAHCYPHKSIQPSSLGGFLDEQLLNCQLQLLDLVLQLAAFRAGDCCCNDLPRLET